MADAESRIRYEWKVSDLEPSIDFYISEIFSDGLDVDHISQFAMILF